MEKQQTQHRAQNQRSHPQSGGRPPQKRSQGFRRPPQRSEQRPPQGNPQNASQNRRPPQNMPPKRPRRIKPPMPPKKRRRKRILWYSCTVAVLLIICCILSMTLFFKIDTITVDGTTRYETADIIKHCGIKKGENLLLCDTQTGVSDIEKAFPYIETVWIERQLFNTVVVHVEETTPASVVESGGQYIVLSTNGKILEIDNEVKYDVPILKGVKIKNAELASMIEYEDDSLQSIIQEVIESMERYGLNNVHEIDVSNPANISFTYNDRITVILGTPENIDYKLKTVDLIINDKLDTNAEGVLDVSLCTSEGGKSYFNPNTEERSLSQQVSPIEPSDDNNEESTAEASENSGENTE